MLEIIELKTRVAKELQVILLEAKTILHGLNAEASERERLDARRSLGVAIDTVRSINALCSED